jgi:hypothetical protein
MKAFTRFLIAAIGAAAFASCTANGNLIYLNIQKTAKTNTSSNIPLNITIADMVNVTNSSVPGNAFAPYYAAAGKIYNGTVSNGSTNWSAISTPNNMICNTLTYDGKNNQLWAGFFSPDGSTFGLYWSTPGSNTWTLATDTLHPNAQITYLGVPSTASGSANLGDLFVVVEWMSNGSPMYELDTAQTVSGGNPASWYPTGLTSSTNPITGVGLVGTTNTYYATSGNTLYWASAAGWPTTIAFAAVPSTTFRSGLNDLLQGIYVDPLYSGGSPLVAVPSSNQTTQTAGVGGVFYSTDGGSTWNEAQSNAGTSYNAGFLGVAGPVDLGHTTYLVGADSGYGGSFGFFYFVPSSITLQRFNGISYSLYASAVRRIMVDITNNIIAMGTINNGLWVTTGVNTNIDSNTWTQE